MTQPPPSIGQAFSAQSARLFSVAGAFAFFLVAFVTGAIGYTVAGSNGGLIGVLAGAALATLTAAVVITIALANTGVAQFQQRHPWASRWIGQACYAALIVWGVWFVSTSNHKDAVATRRLAVIGLAATAWAGDIVSRSIAFFLTVPGLLVIIALTLWAILQQLVSLNRVTAQSLQVGPTRHDGPDDD
jgi:hypothetical protein